jgi:hypothetical protein
LAAQSEAGKAAEASERSRAEEAASAEQNRVIAAGLKKVREAIGAPDPMQRVADKQREATEAVIAGQHPLDPVLKPGSPGAEAGPVEAEESRANFELQKRSGEPEPLPENDHIA